MHAPHKTPHQDFRVRVVTKDSEKEFTDLIKARRYYTPLLKAGKNPRIERIGERPVALAVGK
jgi:hypothetical protein